MVSASPERPCPHPNICPMGQKPAEFKCRMVFELGHGEPDDPGRTVEHFCAFCQHYLLNLKAFFEMQNRRVAGPGIVLPRILPGNNGQQ